ncbi:MAG: GNAT family N-acetyltransferase [Pseudomonadales bacterium]|nr:GNAT family N-acetyltransferase [Pseudomonadales bacterium]
MQHEVAPPPKGFFSRDRFDINFGEIHHQIRPADVRDFDRITARVRRRSAPNAAYQTFQVWRISPLGVELVCDDSALALVRSDRIDLELTVAGQVSHFEGLVVDLIRENSDITLAGVRLSNALSAAQSEEDKRRSPRWLCSEDFYPTCVCPTPGRFNEYMYFQVRDISREGLQLLCSLRNKYLIPGMVLNLTTSFPMVGEITIPVLVKRIGVKSEREKDYLVVGTEYQDITKTSRNVIGQYLLQFSNVETLADLKEAGFLVASVARSTDFYFLKSESDYEEVLKLRLMAHQSGGTLGQDANLYEMSDRYDSNSRIIVAKRKGRIIGSARIHYSALEDSLEHEKYIEWPATFPRRDSVLEITRVCTHPNFRSNDLLAAMLKFLGITCFQPQRPWVLVSSIDALVPFYRKIGLQASPFTYQHPIYSGRQNILLTNAFDILLGRGVNPIYWNAIWREVYDYQLDAGSIRPTALDKARIRIYRSLGPVANLLANISRRPRQAK